MSYEGQVISPSRASRFRYRVRVEVSPHDAEGMAETLRFFLSETDLDEWWVGVAMPPPRRRIVVGWAGENAPLPSTPLALDPSPPRPARLYAAFVYTTSTSASLVRQHSLFKTWLSPEYHHSDNLEPSLKELRRAWTLSGLPEGELVTDWEPA